MVTITKAIAAAVFVTTQDIFDLEDFKPYKKARQIVAIGLTGSTAAFDTGLNAKDGERLVADILNHKTGGITNYSIDRVNVRQGMRTQGEWSAFPTVNAGDVVYLHLEVNV